jgi:GDP/UDP-N,N'-diacetylbacillosamine 2-epimerase (hydrolysing)
MRKICVVTGSRAEFGLLYWLLKGLQSTDELLLQICVTGMHLSPEFGLTYKDIESSGFMINEKVEMLISSDTNIAITQSIGIGTIGMAGALSRLNPDIIVILGDRYEMLSVAIAALNLKIPIAHCHGGETSEGVVDEAIRHSITKMSHIHFTSTESHRKRVIQLGENPARVFNVGALGIDNINKLPLLSRGDFESAIGFKLKSKNILITFHPVTLENNTSEYQFNNLLICLDKQKDTGLLFTKPNADVDGRIISSMIDEYVNNNKSHSISFVSLGQLRYLSALQYVDLVIGNSSSGIIEVPSFGIPTVNIGDRQKGRLRATSVIDCGNSIIEIDEAISKAQNPGFRNSIRNNPNPYGNGNSSEKIIEVLKTVSLNDILKKSFYDNMQ